MRRFSLSSLLPLSALCLVACGFHPKYDPNAYATVYKVGKVENVTKAAGFMVGFVLTLGVADVERDKAKAAKYGLRGSFPNGLNQRAYTLLDYKNREFYAVEGYKNQRFAVGECVVYWTTNNLDNPYYPRLSKAGPNCTAPNQEPKAEDIYMYNAQYLHFRQWRTMNTWFDSSIDSLLKSWGEPTYDKQQLDGRHALHYYKGVRQRWSDGSSRDFECTKTFYVVNRKVEGWQLEGNNCYDF